MSYRIWDMLHWIPQSIEDSQEHVVDYDIEDDDVKSKDKKSIFQHSHLLSTEEQEVIASLNVAKKTKILDMSDSKKVIKFTF